uniref:Uncharacterized protein n=1 Tax=Anopheles dirus TaxID=7168 RepID=A0A182NEM4_9DIPT
MLEWMSAALVLGGKYNGRWKGRSCQQQKKKQETMPNESGRTVTNTPSGERSGGVPRESSNQSSTDGNTGTVKRRPTSLEAKEKTPSPTEETLPQDGTLPENDPGVRKEGSKKSPDRATLSPEAIKSAEKRKTLSESKIPATKTTARLDERLKSKLKPPSVLQRASNLTSSKSGPAMKSTACSGPSGGPKEKKLTSPPSSIDQASSASRTQKKVSFIPNLSVAVSATSIAPGGNIRTSAVKTILRTRAQQSQQQAATDSSVEYKELYRDFPLPLPPYRDPPPAPPVPASTNVGTIMKQRSEPKQIYDEHAPGMEPTKNEDVSAVVRSKLKGFGLGKLISSHTGQERRNTNNYVTLPPSPKASGKTMSSKGTCVGGELPAIPTATQPSQVPPTALPTPPGGQEKPRQPSPDDILAKPEFSSSLFKNIPVRQKKGTVPHLENYCLFDPSVDFFNEKEHKMRAIPESVELADQVLYQDHLIYDAVVDRDSDNYFTIEPESLEIEVKHRLSLEKVEEKIDEIFNKTRTASDSSTSSSSGSSPDYPSMFNSVIETPSSNLESTDESDYGFRNRLMENLKVLVVPKSISGSIPDEDAEGEELMDESTGAEEGAAKQADDEGASSVYYGVVLKSGPIASRLERVHQQQSVSLPNSPLLQHRLQQQSMKQQQQQHRKCDESSSSSSSATVSPPANSSTEGTSSTVTAVGTLRRQNTFTCSGSSSVVTQAVSEGISTSTAQTQGTQKAINTSPSSSSSTAVEQRLTKMKSVTTGGSVTGGKVANFLPLLRSTFALDPLKSSFSLPQLPTAGVAGGNRAGSGSGCAGTGAISKVQSTQQHRNGSLDSTPLFNRLRKRERPLSNHSDADSGFLSPATPPDSNGASILAACDEVMDGSSGEAASQSDAVVLEQCDSIQELIQTAKT